jgi:hypothetical protein
MDARHEIYVDKFSCICSDEGKARAEERLNRAVAIMDAANEVRPRLLEARTVNGQAQYAILLIDFILYWHGGWIRSIAGDQWGGLNVEYNIDYIEWQEGDPDDFPDFEYKLIGRIQFDRTIDGLVEALLLFEERQQHIDKYLEGLNNEV